MIASNTVWTPTSLLLWERIRAHPFADSTRPIDFVAKLMSVQGWTHEQALEAIEEYRRFCFLACVAGAAVTPSDQVDEVWHQHLTHTRDYWEVWCAGVLKLPLHHEASHGGSIALTLHRHQYADTLAHYEQWFGTPAQRWWPGTRERFRRPQRFRRVDLEQVWLLPRLRSPARWANALSVFIAGITSAATAFAIAETPLDWSGPAFLKFFAVAGLIATALAMLWRRALRENGMHPNPAGLTPLEVAYLVNGATRALDTATADLLRQAAVRFDSSQRRFVVGTEPDSGSGPIAALRRLMRNDGRADHVLRLGVSLFSEVRQKLQRLGLLLDDAQARRAALIPASIPGAVLLLGLAKLSVGFQRDRPIGFLVVLCVVMLLITMAFALRMATRSLAGDRAVADLSRQHARAARAPRDVELPLAVALLGTVAMSGTAWADYHVLRTPPSSSSSSDSGGSSDSSSGDSSGGCGGCGGGD
ncbi:MAG: TIGR04222 domain-containing membrane protein [Pseudomonadota bacterium]|nr:TIGR04222 domain-containing membrane protein [Pseudomonadota bacterium]